MTEVEIGPKLIENTGSGYLERSTGCLVGGVIPALVVRNIIVKFTK